MQMHMSLEGQPVTIERRVSARSRRVRLTVYPGGRLVVTAPASAAQPVIQSFINQKSSWILDKLKIAKQAPAYDPAVSRNEYLQHKAGALALIKSRLIHFNAAYGFKYGRVAVKNHRTLWGSCSRKGNLNFNYKLALLPAALADYVIVHELCHLAEFNHSLRFWALVAQTIPNHREIRREIKKIGITLP